jgi:hypothetical protein
MPRKPTPPKPQPRLLFDGITEKQWQFLRLRAFDESDAASARGIRISPRIVEAWKKRSSYFRAMYEFALSQRQLFASGSLFWSVPAASARPGQSVFATSGVPLRQSALLLSRETSDAVFEQEMHKRELAIEARPENNPPTVDLEIPDQHRQIVKPAREMDAGERRLAEALGVEHCLVRGYWDGKPSPGERSWYERAVDVPSDYTPRFRMEKWFPDGVIATSVGLIVLAHGAGAQDVRCQKKRRGRCPLVDLRGVGFASCSYWDFALTSWLDREPPNENDRIPICHRDFAIARQLVYLASVTRRGHGTSGGGSAGFPVILVRGAVEREYWTPRAERWNNMLLDPWRRIRIVDCDVVIDALVGLRVREHGAEVKEVGAHAS